MPKPSLDVWIVESAAVYTEVPFAVVVDWVQQGRLLGDDRVRSHGKDKWHPLSKVAAFAPYLPKAEPFDTASVSESLEPVDLGWKWKRPEETEDEDVDMIPLIDISLVLLIFFMMTATVQSGLFSPIETPQTSFPAEQLAKEQLWIGIDAKGPGLPDPAKRPWFSLGQDNKELVAPTAQFADVLSALGRHLANTKGDVKLRLRADQSLSVDVVTSTMRQLREMEASINRDRPKTARLDLVLQGEVREKTP
jgi:biopolymer transport protein ExbD